MADVSPKGFIAVSDIGKKGNSYGTKLGGRVDIRREVNDINFTVSLTDTTLRDYEAVPWLKDAIVTADKKINSNTTVGVGYDFGVKSAIASVAADTDIASKSVWTKATWFQRGNVVRAEGVVKLDSRNAISGAWTFNEPSTLANSSFINLREREGFIIDPFTYPVATAAAKYTLETKDGYTIEPAWDIHRRAAYLSVRKDHWKNSYRAQYAFAEETAMLEVGHRSDDDQVPLVKAYFKAPIGSRGVGPLSVGFIFDKTFNL